MSKGAKFHTYHTNLSITYYYYYVLGPVFVCDFKTEVLKSTWERNQKEQSNIREHGLKVVFYSPISHLASAPLLPYSLEPDAPTPTHKQPDSSFQTDISMVSSDMPQSHPLPLSSLFLTHWPPTWSLFLLPITCSSVLCASCYMSMSLVIKNASWLSHVLVYWIKENPNIIVINTNNITIHGGSRVLIHN